MKNFFKRKALLIIITAMLVAALTTTFVLLYPSAAKAVGDNPVFAYFKLVQMEKMVQKNHIYATGDDNVLAKAYELYAGTGELKKRELRQEIIRLLKEDNNNYYVLANLVLKDYDRYSSLKTKEQYNTAYPDSEGYKGLGLTVSEYGPFIRVGDVYENSNAGRAGFQPGDLIFSIDGTDIRPMEYQKARQLLADIQGEAVIGVLREGKTFFLNAEIGEVIIPNVSWKITDDVGILRVTLFEEKSFKSDLDDAMKAFQDAGIDRLILDMRDNRGGYIDYAIYFINQFVTEKGEKLFSQTKRKSEKVFSSDGGGYDFNDIVVIVNEKTCSAAEICSGSLKDRGYTLVGTTTYGKAVGLTTYDFFGDKLTLATLTIELPKTGDYNEIGIEPDFPVENTFVPGEKFEVLAAKVVEADSDPNLISALESALCELGYFPEEPNEIWDETTEEALEIFSESFGLSFDSVCSKEIITEINILLEDLSNAVYPEDTQFQAAWEIITNKFGKNAA